MPRQGGQRIERRDAVGAVKQRRHLRRQIGQQRVVQLALAVAGALLRRQRLVLEAFQLGRDEALGVLQRLAAPVVIGHLVELALGDLDVEAVHAVVLDAQVGDAGALALAFFEIEQEGAGVVAQRAQLVELGIEAGGNHIAITRRECRLR